MAKYCAKCGKALPDGVELCPDCHLAVEETEAALFTRITSEAEVWKDPNAKPERRKRSRTPKEKPGLAAAGLLVLAFLIFAIAFTRPAPRVLRAIQHGEYDEAVEIYWGHDKLAQNGSAAVDKAVLKQAQMLCDQYAAGEIEADAAAEALSRLGTLGSNAEALLEENFADFRALFRSQEHLSEAEKLFRNGEYLEARAEYNLVSEDDSDYAAAQEKAAECLVNYGTQVVAEAQKKADAGDYPAAIRTLQAGNRTLEDYGTFSPDIDLKTEEYFAAYESFLLTEAENLSALGNNAGAADLIAGGITEYDMDSEAMLAAREQYLAMARADVIRAARERADAVFAEGEYAAGFDELMQTKKTLEGDPADIDAEITDLEAVFAADRIAAAKELFAGGRIPLRDAVQLLDEAIEVRPLEDMVAYREEIAQYLPLSLVEADTAGKTGTVFRTKSAFESVDGTNYTNGWIWGEDGAEISFKLDGTYDLFEANFAIRRADNKNANGHFELYCDGEQVYKSETLHHWETKVIPINVEIDGCDELKIVFTNDYEVKTAEDGYCYHGLCTPQVLRNLPEAIG